MHMTRILSGKIILMKRKLMIYHNGLTAHNELASRTAERPQSPDWGRPTIFSMRDPACCHPQNDRVRLKSIEWASLPGFTCCSSINLIESLTPHSVLIEGSLIFWSEKATVIGDKPNWMTCPTNVFWGILPFETYRDIYSLHKTL